MEREREMDGSKFEINIKKGQKYSWLAKSLNKVKLLLKNSSSSLRVSSISI